SMSSVRHSQQQYNQQYNQRMSGSNLNIGIASRYPQKQVGGSQHMDMPSPKRVTSSGKEGMGPSETKIMTAREMKISSGSQTHQQSQMSKESSKKAADAKKQQMPDIKSANGAVKKDDIAGKNKK
ncbi:MAG: hypothetical protein ACXWD4_08850, partial [Bacteroidia bacterium]